MRKLLNLISKLIFFALVGTVTMVIVFLPIVIIVTLLGVELIGSILVGLALFGLLVAIGVFAVDEYHMYKLEKKQEEDLEEFFK